MAAMKASGNLSWTETLMAVYSVAASRATVKRVLKLLKASLPASFLTMPMESTMSWRSKTHMIEKINFVFFV